MQQTLSPVMTSLLQGQSLAKQKRFADAEKYYLEALKEEPGHADALFLLGGLYYQQQLYAKAIRIFEKALENDPENDTLLFLLGSSCFGMGAHGRATRYLEECLRITPNHRLAYFDLVQLGLNLKRLGDRKTAPSPSLFSLSPPLLLRLQIEVTTWCNLQCAGCPRTIEIEGGRWENTHMSLDAFKTIVDSMPPSNTLCLQGVGESTLNPEFPAMVAYAKQSGNYKFLTLNTNLLARPIDYYKGLKDAGLSHISVSVDSFDPQIAADCRKGTVVDKLYERLRELAALYSPDVVTVSIVASKRNIDDIPNTLQKLDAMGRFSVEIQGLIIYDPDKQSEGNEPYALRDEDINTIRKYMIMPYRNLHITFPQGDVHNSSTRCTRPFVSPYVTASGYLTPCCTIEDASLLGYTKIDGRPFSEIYQEPLVQAWLKDYAVNSHAFCKGCCFFSG